VVLGYVVLTTAYSLVLKTLPLADVFTLAALYLMRLIAGGVATDTPISIWLLGFSSFLFLALALVKRSAELMAMSGSGIRRRGYTKQDEIVLQIMGIASSFASSLILMLYVDSEAATSAYPARPILYGIVPTMLFWQCRLWLFTVRGYMEDDPIVYASKDWVSWATFVVVLALSLTATFVELPLQL
jgi:4-hydroxybenzoate polyprenyltransferase